MDGQKKTRCWTVCRHEMEIFLFLSTLLEEYVNLLKVVKAEIYDLGKMLSFISLPEKCGQGRDPRDPCPQETVGTEKRGVR